MSEPHLKPNRKLGGHQLATAEYQRNDWIATPALGTQPRELTDPGYWASVAHNMRVWDRIDVRAADGTWWVELLVVAVEPFAVKVHPLRFWQLDRAADPGILPQLEEAVPDGYEIRYRGDKARWCVLRLSDSIWVREGELSRGHAALWLQRHLRVLGGVATDEDRQAAAEPAKPDLVGRGDPVKAA